MEEVIEYIKEHNLGSKDRYRNLTYRRFYIYHILREEGLTYDQIAKLFNRTHASIISGLKIHRDYTSIKDQLYEFLTAEERLKFEGFKIERDLIKDIFSCDTLEQLKIIKIKLKNNGYSFPILSADKVI